MYNFHLHFDSYRQIDTILSETFIVSKVELKQLNFYYNLQMVSLGGFILFFGFLAFNGGSQASIAEDGDAAAVALAIVNTILSGMYISPASLTNHV